MRELQLEKHALENANLQQQLSAVNSVNDRLRTENNNLEGRIAKQNAALKEDQERLQMVTQERDGLRRMKDNMEGSQLSVAAKDEQIAAVMKEGTQLSEKVGKLEQSLRKVKKELREKEAEIEAMKQERVAKDSHFENIQDKLRSIQQEEKQRNEEIYNLKQKIDELSAKSVETDEVRKKYEKEKADLTALLDIEKIKVEERNKIVEKLNEELTRLSDERQGMSKEMEEKLGLVSESSDRERSLLANITELQAALRKTSQEDHAKMEAMQLQIRELSEKYHDAEARNEQLVSAVPEATRPLLRQLTGLQSTMQARQQAWEDLEIAMKNQIKEKDQLASRLKVDKEMLQETVATLERDSTEKEAKLNASKQRITNLEASLASAQASIEKLTEEVGRMRAESGEDTSRLKQENEDLSRRLTEVAEKSKRLVSTLQKDLKQEQEVRQKLQAELDRYSQLSKQQQQQQQQLHTTPASASSSSSSSNHPPPSLQQPELSINNNNDITIAIDSHIGGVSSMVEMLRSMVRAKEGEAATLRAQTKALEASRNELSDEVVALKQKVTALAQAAVIAHQLKSQLQTLTLRHAAAMQLIGEKEEALADLQTDLADLKAMYRKQTEEIVRK